MDEPPPAKKARLSMACNECRRRKVRCDANYPQCRNCANRNSECFTSDIKRPGVPVVREWIEDKAMPPQSTIDSSNVANKTAEISQSPSISRDGAHIDGSVPPSDSGLNQVSPVYHPYDMSFQSEHQTKRFKMMGGSSSQCLMKSLDVYLQTASIKPVSSNFQYGMRHAEEIVLPLALTLPAFPPTDVCSGYENAYFSGVHVLWPLLDIDETKKAVKYFASITDLSTIPRDQIPALASAYLVVSIGADEEARAFTQTGEKYLMAAAEMLGHVITVPYLQALQALLLFTIAYRGRNKDGLGWQTIGMAIRTAHSLGLHKHSAIKPSNEHGVTQRQEQLYHARVWAVCCCLEKMMQLESGRPSAIATVNRDQMMGQAQRAPGHDFLQWNMGLAEYQGEISQHIYGHSPGERTAQEILLTTARLDLALLAWSNQIPLQFQPTSALFCSKEDLHYAAFLSIQFHQAMISLHRAALIAPRHMFDAEVEKYCSNEPSKHRLERGELICTESARAIIRLYVEVQESKAGSRIFSTGPALLACAALSISLMKNARGKMQAADLELLKAGVELASSQYLKSGQDQRMAQGVVTIHERIRQHFRQISTAQKRGRDRTPPGSRRAPPTQASSNLPSSRDFTSQSIPLAPPPTYHTVVSTAVAPLDHVLNRSSSYVDQNNLGGDMVTNMYDDTSWKSVSPGQMIPFRADGTSEGFTAGQDSELDVGLDSSQLPFSGYNAEELWNWMYFIDTDSNSHVLMQGSI